MIADRRLSNHLVAKMRPQNLMKQPQFWLFHQWRILVLIVSVIGAIAFLWPFIFPKGDSVANLTILCWIIILIMFIGIGWIGFAASKVEVDEAVAVEIQKVTDEEFEKLKNREKEQIELSVVRSLIPKNISALITMPRLSEHIIKNAEDRKFDSSVIIMQPYREEILNDIFKINGLQKASLQLGIVGTFLGLIAAFIELGDSGQEITAALPQIIDALKYSFSTSIAGLVGALSISMGVLLILKRQQESFYRTMEEATDSLIRVCRNARNKDVFLNSFDQIKESVDQVQNEVDNQTKKLQIQTRTISDGINRLTETKTEFEGFLGEITKIEGKFITEMRDIYHKLSPETTSAELKRSLSDAVSGISASLNQNLTHSINEYNTLNQNLAVMGENLGQMEERLSKQSIDFEAHSQELRTLQKGLHEYVKKLSDRQDHFVDQITGNHVSTVLVNSVESVGEELSKKQSKDLTRVITNMQSLEKELNYYNKLVKKELEQQTPYTAMQTLVYSVVTLARTSVKYVFTLVRNLFSPS